MVLLLVHLRRLILLLSIVYLCGAVLRRLLTHRHYAAQPLQSNRRGALLAGHWSKEPLHFQWWAYIYTCYIYILLVNYVSTRRLVNLIEILFN